MSLASNEVFRGESLSGDDPAISVALGFDGPAGTFVGASGSVSAGDHDPRLIVATQFAGISARNGPLSVEAGVIHRSYHRVVDTAYRRDYFEFFAGASSRTAKLRLFFSPDYHRTGRTSYYIDGNARVATVGMWSFDAHGGLSLVPEDGHQRGLKGYRDWRLSASRPIGDFYVAAGVAGTNYPVFGKSGRARAFATINMPF